MSAYLGVNLLRGRGCSALQPQFPMGRYRKRPTLGLVGQASGAEGRGQTAYRAEFVALFVADHERANAIDERASGVGFKPGPVRVVTHPGLGDPHSHVVGGINGDEVTHAARHLVHLEHERRRELVAVTWGGLHATDHRVHRSRLVGVTCAELGAARVGAWRTA